MVSITIVVKRQKTGFDINVVTKIPLHWLRVVQYPQVVSRHLSSSYIS